MSPKQKAKQKVKQKQKQKQKQSQSIVVNIGKNRTTGRKRLPPQSQSIPSIPSIIQLPPQQPDYSSILTAMMQHQTRSLSQKEPIINNLTPTPTPSPIQTAEPQTAEPQRETPQIQASPYQQLTQQQRRDLSSAAAERRAGNTASNFQAQPSSLAPPPLPPPPSEASKVSGKNIYKTIEEAKNVTKLVQATLSPIQEATPIREPDSYFNAMLVNPLKGEPEGGAGEPAQPPAAGGAAEEAGEKTIRVSKKKAEALAAEAAAEAAAAAKRKEKADEASKRQREEKTNFMKSIEMKLDKGEPLTQAEISRLMSNKQLGKKIKQKLISKGYDLFKVSN